jgi:hypothetical protein
MKKKKKADARSPSHAASGSAGGRVGGGFVRSPSASGSEGGSGSESGKKRRRERTAAERVALRLQIDDASYEYQEKKKQRKSTAATSTRKSAKTVSEAPTSTVAKLAALIAPMRVRLLVARLQPLDPRTGRYVIPATGAPEAQRRGAVKREAPPAAAASAALSSGGASAVEYNDRDAGATSRIADERGHFLQFCMENHLQFDTLRRAKHSTSLVLHMLHNPQHAVVPERLVVEAQAARARAETLPIPEGGAAAPPPVPQPRAFDVITAHAPELTYSAGAMAQAIALIRTSREAASSADQASDGAAVAAASVPNGLSSLATATTSS